MSSLHELFIVKIAWGNAIKIMFFWIALRSNVDLSSFFVTAKFKMQRLFGVPPRQCHESAHSCNLHQFEKQVLEEVAKQWVCLRKKVIWEKICNWKLTNITKQKFIYFFSRYSLSLSVPVSEWCSNFLSGIPCSSFVLESLFATTFFQFA